MPMSLPSILGESGNAALRRQLAGPSLIAFDFDGTLAPIVEHPPHARLEPAVEALLRRLARASRVVIVSGRALDDLRERAPIGAFRLIGNHGNDTVDTDPALAAHSRAICRRWRQALEQAIAVRFAGETGVEIEDKGTTLSIHYRRARDPLAAREALVELVAQIVPAPQVIGGKLVLNLLPPGMTTKFEALQRLAEETGTQRILFIGDDDTDEIVFERAPREWLTVRVEPGASSAARFSLPAQDDVARLIERMLQALSDPGPQLHSA